MTTQQQEIDLRPGDKINLVMEVERETLLGKKTVTQVKESLTYEEILTAFQNKNTPKTRNVTVPMEAREFNRFAALSQTAVEKGTWLGGSQIDPKKAVTDVVARVKALPENLYSFVSAKAQGHLDVIAQNSKTKPDQKKEIKDFIAKLSA